MNECMHVYTIHYLYKHLFAESSNGQTTGGVERAYNICYRRNKACIFRKLTQIILSWNLSFLQNILELRLSQILSLKSTDI